MNDPNPYQSPASPSHRMIVAETDWSAQPDERIMFSVSLTRRDVQRFFPKPLSFGAIFAVVLLLLALLVVLGSSVTFPFLVVVLCVATMMVTIRLRLNWKFALRQTPRLLKPTTGYISRDGLFTSSDGYQGFSRWNDIHAIRTTNDCALISGEGWRLVSLILPWESFDDPDAAYQAFQSVQQQHKSAKPVLFGDERLRQDPIDTPIYQPPERHVAFNGDLTFAQIAASGPGKKIKRATYKFLALGIIAFLAGCLIFLAGFTWFFLVGLPLWAFALVLFFMLARHPMNKRPAESVAFRSRGWFYDAGFFLQAATGQSFRQWNAIDRVWCDESMICIRLPGIADAWFFFARTQFASDEDFAQACQWAESGLDA